MFWKKKRLEGTTIFFSSDIHASTVCFRKFVNAAKYYGGRGQPVDILMVGGDITGKMIVPIVKSGNGSHRSYLFGKQLTLDSQEEVDELIRKTEVLGIYPHIFEADEYTEFQDDPEFQGRLFRELALGRLQEWMDIAAEKLSGGSVRCFMSPGNDDFDECKDVIDACPVITCPDMKTLPFDDDHEMISLGYANPTPFDCPRDVTEEELTERMESMIADVKDVSRCIFNLHVPPVESGLDDAPELDEDLRPKMGTTGVNMIAVGSRSVRTAIEKYQPLLALHGHVHESRGAVNLGRTLCINPGSEYSDGILRGALVTVGKDKVLSHLLTSG